MNYKVLQVLQTPKIFGDDKMKIDDGNLKIPFIVGVTGHRDLTEESRKSAQEEVAEVFKNLNKLLPNTEIYLLSPLADGADRIVAEAALDHNIKLISPLPFQKEEYLNDFNDSSKDEFNALLKKAEKSYFIGYSENTSDNRDKQYEKLGKHIADSCNLLIALWDGKESTKIGGTSQVVKYKETGFQNELFDGLDGNAIQYIKVEREKKHQEETSIRENYKSEFKALGFNIDTKEEYDELLAELDSANEVIIQNNKLPLRGKSHIENLCEFYSDVATKYQDNFNSSSFFVIGSAWLAVLSLELLHNFHLMIFMFIYLLVILLAFGYYYFVFDKGEKQDKFLFFRGLSEALRVQMYWNRAGVNENVSKYYLKKQYSNVTWLKIALNNLVFREKHVLETTDKPDINEVIHEWIDGQINYFKAAIKKREKNYERLEKLEKYFYNLGLVSLIITFAIFLVYHFTHEYEFIFHVGLFVSGMSLVTAGFIGEKFLYLKGHKEALHNFRIMDKIFKKARNLLSNNQTDSKKILLELGKEALDENSLWVSLHYSRKLKPSME
ncbi:hypothetical protein [Sulfurimonas sp. ST-27]|uniref:hypothetical protein n=1 Tax=Sulfurimonas sp. ST-27 TaxID=3400152 RepID=UPI003AB2CB64